MKKSMRYSPEVMERTVRMVQEAGSEYEPNRPPTLSQRQHAGGVIYAALNRRWRRQRQSAGRSRAASTIATRATDTP